LHGHGELKPSNPSRFAELDYNSFRRLNLGGVYNGDGTAKQSGKHYLKMSHC